MLRAMHEWEGVMLSSTAPQRKRLACPGMTYCIDEAGNSPGGQPMIGLGAR